MNGGIKEFEHCYWVLCDKEKQHSFRSVSRCFIHLGRTLNIGTTEVLLKENNFHGVTIPALCSYLPISKGQQSQNPVLCRKLSQCKIQAPSALMTTELFYTEIKLFLMVLEQFPQLLKGESIFLPSKEPRAACNVARNFLHLSWQLLNKLLSKELDFSWIFLLII